MAEILLLGGTSDTAPIAAALVQVGLRVLVSTATDAALDIGCHPSIRRRSGPLDESSLAALIRDESIRVIVDATHPYAAQIRATARSVAERLHLPYLTYIRPPAVGDQGGDAGDPAASAVQFADDHEQAAVAAFSFSKAVLLTTGSRNLEPYVRQSRLRKLPLVVRVLPGSREACLRAGIAEDDVIAERGPFSVEANRGHIRRFGAGVLVTKDGGKAGGAIEKLQAAAAEGCRVIVIRRPKVGADGFGDIASLVVAVTRAINPPALP